MTREESFTCPHCNKLLDEELDNGWTLDKMGRDWHRECWEAFKKERGGVWPEDNVSFHFEDPADQEDRTRIGCACEGEGCPACCDKCRGTGLATSAAGNITTYLCFSCEGSGKKG